MRRRLLAWLLASLALHVGLAAAGLAAWQGAAPQALFLDLVHDFRVAEAPRASDSGGPGPVASAVGRGAAPSPGPRARSDPPAPSPPVSPRPAPPPTAPGLTPAARWPEWLSEPAPPSVPALLPTHEEPADRARPPQTAGEILPVTPRLPRVPPAAGGSVPPVPAAAAAAAEEPAPAAAAGRHGQTGPSSRSGAGPPSAEPSRRAAGAAQGSSGGVGLDARDGAALALALPAEGGAGAGEDAAYLGLVRRRIVEALTYPPVARRRGLTGTVQLELEIQPTGAISRVAVVASSSHDVLDDAALAAVHGLRAVPFPAGVPPRRLRVHLPVVFDLR